jgi:hypothetical protein
LAIAGEIGLDHNAPGRSSVRRRGIPLLDELGQAAAIGSARIELLHDRVYRALE